MTSPTTLRAAPDGRVFIGFQEGEIRVVEHDVLLSEPFATLATDGAGERGLQGLALDPDFESNGYLYVYYTASSPQSHNRVSRLQADLTAPNRMLAGSETVLLELPNLATLPDTPNPIWHMGGALQVAPDGTLRVQIGDHVNSSLVQNLDSPLGKVLRLNRDGSVPTNNPYYSAADGLSTRDMVWSLGLRNPYSGDIDPLTGRYYVGDVGQGSWEEIDDATQPARNFGWPTTEGDFNPATFPNLTRPVYAYGHDEDCAITGGAFYRPTTAQFPSEYDGVYFFSEFCSGEIQYIDPDNLAAGAQPFLTGAAYPLHISVAADGSMYYLARGAGAGGDPGLGTGQLRKVQHAANAAPSIVDPPDDQLVSVGYSATFSASVNGSSPLTLQWQRRSAGANSFADIPGATGAGYVISNTTLADDGAQFRLRATNGLGTVNSAEATLHVTTNRPPTATITSPSAALRYSGGDVIHFAGSGSDFEDGALPASSLVWWIDFHHDTHLHPFLPPVSGISGGDFTIPTISETDPDVFFRLHLRVTDSVGLTTETTADILPRKANLTLTTNVPGLLVELDGQAQSTPLTVEGVANLRRTIGAAEVQTIGGQSYRFASWSDGGARSHAIGFPSADTTLIAQYVPVALTYLSDLPFAGTPTNGWGPVERDKSNGGTASGDGKTLTLNGATYAKGLGVHARSDVLFNLNGGYDRFFATVGIDGEVSAGSVVFQVFGDGTLLYDSGLMGASSPAQAIDVSVLGVRQLRLVVNDGGDGIDSDHADWADAKLLGISTIKTTYLSDLPFASTPTNGWGPVERDLSNGETAAGDGRTLTINGVTYAKGLGVHAGSDVRFNLNGAYEQFLATVGLDDEVTAGGVVFQVYGDGTLLFDSGLLGATSPARQVDVNVHGLQQLRLVVTDGGNGVNSDHADWADAKLLGAPPPPFETTYLSDLPFASSPTNGWGPVERDLSNGDIAAGDGRTLTINGVTYAKGLGVHAGSDVRFNLNGAYDQFQATVGVDDEVRYGSVVFQVYGDGVLLYDSGLLGQNSAAQPLDVSVAGVQQLRLVVTNGGDGIDSDHADWANARLIAAPAVETTYLSDLPFVGTPTNGWGPVERNLSNGEIAAGDGRTLTLNGATFAKGLGVHAGSSITFNLAASYIRFQAQVGLDDEVSAGSVVFQVYGDNALLFDSGLLGPKSPALAIDVSVLGVQQLRLVVTDGGNGIDSDHADWADAKLLSAAASTQPTYESTYLSDLPFAGTPSNGWGPVERDKSNGEIAAGDGRTLTLNGATFAKGLGVHAASSVSFNLGGSYDRFQAKVGLDDEVSSGSVVFQVYGDNVLLFDSGLLGPKSPALPVDISVQGVLQLRLVVTDGGNGISSDHADWADAKLLKVVAPTAALFSVEAFSAFSISEPAARLVQDESSLPADAPVAQADRYVLGATHGAQAASDSLLANDDAPSGTAMEVLLTTDPAKGSVKLNEDGTFSYTPGSSFHGYDTFKYKPFDAYSTGNEVTVEIFSHTGALVAKAYQTVLGRNFDLGGLEYWVQKIEAPGGSLSDFATGVFESRERLEPIIKNWYRQYLGRAQDPKQSEIDFYYNRWRNEGGPQNMLPDLFASNEFYQNSGGTNRGWISELYRLIVQRATPPNENEIAFYEGRLTNGASRQSVVRGFLLSPEKLGLIVNDLYQRILGRAPTSTEKQTEVDALGAGKTEKQLQLQLLDSNEYRSVPSQPTAGNAVRY